MNREKLNQQELRRFERHISLDEIGESGQTQLKNSNVLIVGAGGLGCPVIQYLSAAGVGHISIIDSDKVDESNIQRQVLYGVRDVGKLKSISITEKIRKTYPYINIKMLVARLDQSNADRFIPDYDLIIDCTDNIQTRYVINDACKRHEKSWIYGSVYKYEGQVSVFNYQGGPDYRDFYPEIDETKTIQASEVGIFNTAPGIIGTIQASEAIKVLLNIGTSLSGKILVYDSLHANFYGMNLKK